MSITNRVFVLFPFLINIGVSSAIYVTEQFFHFRLLSVIGPMFCIFLLFFSFSGDFGTVETSNDHKLCPAKLCTLAMTDF